MVRNLSSATNIKYHDEVVRAAACMMCAISHDITLSNTCKISTNKLIM